MRTVIRAVRLIYWGIRRDAVPVIVQTMFEPREERNGVDIHNRWLFITTEREPVCRLSAYLGATDLCPRGGSSGGLESRTLGPFPRSRYVGFLKEWLVNPDV
jgi:hypothetical protein